jgi:hypothetical protein
MTLHKSMWTAWRVDTWAPTDSYSFQPHTSVTSEAGQELQSNASRYDMYGYASYCVNIGLRPQGVREAYCLLLYPNSSGAPGAATGP